MVFKKINKISKPVAKLIKGKKREERTHMNNSRNESGNINIHSLDIKRLIKEQ